MMKRRPVNTDHRVMLQLLASRVSEIRGRKGCVGAWDWACRNTGGVGGGKEEEMEAETDEGKEEDKEEKEEKGKGREGRRGNRSEDHELSLCQGSQTGHVIQEGRE